MFRWNAERDARLNQLFSSLIEYSSIAKIMTDEFGEEATRKSISMRCGKIGLSRKTFICWKPEHDAYAKELYAHPASYSHGIIADKLNAKFGTEYSRNAVIGRLNRMRALNIDPNRVVKPRQPRITKPRNVNRKGVSVVRRPRLTQEIVQLRCIEIEPRNVSFAELERGECRWPYGDGPYTFCGHPQMVGASYCTNHHLLSLRSPYGEAA